MTRFEFELHGAEVAQRGVQTLTIVPAFDVLEDGCASLGTCGELRSCALGFESREKAFHGGIIEAITDAAHTDQAMMSGQVLLIGLAGVLAASIRVVQKASRWTALHDGHAPSLLYQRGFHVLIHCPSHHSTRKQIQNRSQIQPAFGGVDVGDIAHPFSIWRKR